MGDEEADNKGDKKGNDNPLQSGGLIYSGDLPDAPKIEFPCAYPITVLGDAADDFAELVVTIVQRHDPSLDVTTMSYRDSRNGRFRSVRLTMRATGKTQLEALFVELKASGRVRMVI